MPRYLPFNKIAVLAVVFAFIGCEQTDLTYFRPHTFMKVRVGLVGVDTTLVAGKVSASAKTSTIALARLILKFTSNANDTISDTITTHTIPWINPSTDSLQVITKDYPLLPYRWWKVVGMTWDVNDSLINKDSTVTPVLHEGDTVNVYLNLSSRYNIFQIKIMSIPDSVTSISSGKSVPLCLNRFVFKIDSLSKVDTSTPGCFTAPLAFEYDYVTTKTHTFELLAYGPFAGWDLTKPLYDGSTTFTVVSGKDTTTDLILNWVGPVGTSTESIFVKIGKVNKITVNGVIPVIVLP
jgi:hypothetical protein